jgi:hypothetical protein
MMWVIDVSSDNIGGVCDCCFDAPFDCLVEELEKPCEDSFGVNAGKTRIYSSGSVDMNEADNMTGISWYP